VLAGAQSFHPLLGAGSQGFAGTPPLLAGPMGARPLALDGGEWTQRDATQGANWLRKEESLTPHKLINRSAAGWEKE